MAAVPTAGGCALVTCGSAQSPRRLTSRTRPLPPLASRRRSRDTMSGAKDDRPGLAALMDYVRQGDTAVVWKLDRLGRNTLHILETVKTMTERGVTLISTTDGIDSSTAAGRMVIGVLASMAEFERELVKNVPLSSGRRPGPTAPGSGGPRKSPIRATSPRRVG